MKKETIVTAVVFLIVGFLAGYIVHAQLGSESEKGAEARTAAKDGNQAQSGVPALQANPAGGGALQGANPGGTSGLPPGHPPVEVAAQMRELQQEAMQNPSDPKPRLALANLLYDNRQFENAIEWYQRALELDPRNVNARTDLGTAYFYSGRAQDALREYQEALKANPNHAQTLYNLVIVNLEGTHDFRAAQSAWERLQRQDPNYPGLAGLRAKLDAAVASATTRSSAESPAARR